MSANNTGLDLRNTHAGKKTACYHNKHVSYTIQNGKMYQTRACECGLQKDFLLGNASPQEIEKNQFIPGTRR